MDKEYTLVTGATGFIGSHLVDSLLQEGHHVVVAIVRNSSERKKCIGLEEKGVVLVEGSFYDEILLQDVFDKLQIQNVIHLAAVRGAGRGTREDYLNINIYGTEILLKHSFKNNVKNFIYCSSVGVNGTIPGDLPATLTTPLNGDNRYHSSKIIGEQKVLEFIRQGLNAYIVRPTITYGNGDNGFTSMLVKLVRRRLFVLPVPDIKIHLLDVGSLSDVFVKILRAGHLSNKVFIVADKSPVSIRDLVNAIYHAEHGNNYPSFLRLPCVIFDLIGIFFNLVSLKKWSTRVSLISRPWYYDISATVNELGFEPSDTLSYFTTRNSK